MEIIPNPKQTVPRRSRQPSQKVRCLYDKVESIDVMIGFPTQAVNFYQSFDSFRPSPQVQLSGAQFASLLMQQNLQTGYTT